MWRAGPARKLTCRAGLVDVARGTHADATRHAKSRGRAARAHVRRRWRTGRGHVAGGHTGPRRRPCGAPRGWRAGR